MEEGMTGIGIGAAFERPLSDTDSYSHRLPHPGDEPAGQYGSEVPLYVWRDLRSTDAHPRRCWGVVGGQGPQQFTEPAIALRPYSRSDGDHAR